MNDHQDRDRPDPLVSATLLVAHRLGEINEQLRLISNNQALLKRMAEMESKIMSAISDFAVNQNAFNDRVDTAIAGLTEDVQTLNDKITELQNSPGQITPEDQAMLDAIQVRSEGITAKLEALDALTPPKIPVG